MKALRHPKKEVVSKGTGLYDTVEFVKFVSVRLHLFKTWRKSIIQTTNACLVTKILQSQRMLVYVVWFFIKHFVSLPSFRSYGEIRLVSKTAPISEVSFPALVFCNINPLSKSFMYAILSDEPQFTNVSHIWSLVESEFIYGRHVNFLKYSGPG